MPEHEKSKAQEKTTRAHLTQKVIEFLCGEFHPPSGLAEVVSMKQVGDSMFVELVWKKTE